MRLLIEYTYSAMYDVLLFQGESDLPTLVQILCVTFAESIPVYKRQQQQPHAYAPPMSTPGYRPPYHQPTYPPGGAAPGYPSSYPNQPPRQPYPPGPGSQPSYNAPYPTGQPSMPVPGGGGGGYAPTGAGGGYPQQQSTPPYTGGHNPEETQNKEERLKHRGDCQYNDSV